MLRNIMAAISYLACVVLGAILGYLLGYLITIVLIRFGIPESLQKVILENNAVVTLATCGSLFGGLYGIARSLWGYGAYNDLIEKKNLHRKIYYGVRKWYQLPVDTGTDIAWAAAYVVVGTFFPPFATAIGLGFINAGFQAIAPNDLLLVWLVIWFLYLFYVIPFLMQVFTGFVDELFQPKKLLKEIDEAEHNLQVIARRLEEERILRERLRDLGDDLRGRSF